MGYAKQMLETELRFMTLNLESLVKEAKQKTGEEIWKQVRTLTAQCADLKEALKKLGN